MLGLEAGSIFGKRYEIIKYLGAGATGSVYLACDREHRSFQVALKVLYPGVLSSPHSLARFRQEIIASYSINHINIVRAYEYFDEATLQAYAMEYVDGGDLLSRMVKERIDQETATNILAQISAGLAAIHEKGIVHRDLKPANILLSSDSTIKISDFGVARLTGSATLTNNGSTVGTPKYLAPEYIQTGECDHRGDLYALGVIGYEMIAGVSPFKADTPISIMVERFKQQQAPLLQLVPNCNPELVRIIEKSMAFDVNSRYQSASELYQDLLRLQLGDKTESVDLLLHSKSLPPKLPAIISNSVQGVLKKLSGSHQAPFTRPRGSTRSDLAIPSTAIFISRLITPRKLIIYFFAALIFSFAASLYISFRGKIISKTLLPQQISGLIAHYEANSLASKNGELVASWSDSNHNALLATQPEVDRQPTIRKQALNGFSVLKFDGVNDFLFADQIGASIGAGSGLSVVFVARTFSPEKQYLWGAYSWNNENDLVRAGFSPGLKFSVSRTDPEGVELYLSVGADTSKFSIYSTLFEDRKVQTYINGKIAIDLATQTPVNLSASTNFVIGQDWEGANTSDFFSGELAEIIVYDRFLSTEQREGLEDYLKSKYAIKLHR